MRGLGIVLGYAAAMLVQQAQIVLGMVVALLGGETVPPRGLRIVPDHAAPVREKQSEVELSVSVSLFGGETKPAGGLGKIRGHAPSVDIQGSQVALSIRLALLRAQPEPLYGLGNILGHTAPFKIKASEYGLCDSQALLGGKTEPPRRLCVVLRYAASLQIIRPVLKQRLCACILVCLKRCRGSCLLRPDRGPHQAGKSNHCNSRQGSHGCDPFSSPCSVQYHRHVASKTARLRVPDSLPITFVRPRLDGDSPRAAAIRILGSGT